MTGSLELAESVQHLRTKSEKIRALARRGVERADIARALGIRYQHVRNVLEQDKAREATAGMAEPPQFPFRADNMPSVKVRLGPDGRVVIPASIRDALGLKEGDVLFARLEGGRSSS